MSHSLSLRHDIAHATSGLTHEIRFDIGNMYSWFEWREEPLGSFVFLSCPLPATGGRVGTQNWLNISRSIHPAWLCT